MIFIHISQAQQFRVRLTDPHYLYELGPAIFPRESIPTNDPNGQYRLYGNGRKWVFIDLLLTSGSVAESAVKSRERENQ